jgi:hypothetical protein
VLIALLLAAEALLPSWERQLRAALPPGGERRIEPVFQKEGLVLYCILSPGRAQLKAAAFEESEMVRDPEDLGGPMKREGCGTASASETFLVRRGKRRERAVVVSAREGAAPAFVTAVLNIETGKLLAWTEQAPPRGEAIVPQAGNRGETAFCAFTEVPGREKGWALLTWSDDAEGYAPSGACRPRGSAK